MAWPKGKKRKPEQPATTTVGTNGLATLEVPPKTSASFDLVLGIRRIRHGNFAGLWELSELAEENGTVRPLRILTDANIKPILLAQIGRALSRCF